MMARVRMEGYLVLFFLFHFVLLMNQKSILHNCLRKQEFVVLKCFPDSSVHRVLTTISSDLPS